MAGYDLNLSRNCKFRFIPFETASGPILTPLLILPLPATKYNRYSVSEDAFWRNYFYRVEMLKQMSKKGTDLKQGWASSRSSSGEGPDEITSSTIDTGQNEYDNSGSKSKGAVEPVEELANNLVKESLDFDTSASSMSRMNEKRQPQLQQQTSYKSATDTSELESSESRKLVAEADDLKSRLRELNIGSLDGGDPDG